MKDIYCITPNPTCVIHVGYTPVITCSTPVLLEYELYLYIYDQNKKHDYISLNLYHLFFL